jgi:hypothetical protein
MKYNSFTMYALLSILTIKYYHPIYNKHFYVLGRNLSFPSFFTICFLYVERFSNKYLFFRLFIFHSLFISYNTLSSIIFCLASGIPVCRAHHKTGYRLHFISLSFMCHFHKIEILFSHLFISKIQALLTRRRPAKPN